MLTIQYKGDNGERGTVRPPFGDDFATLARNNSRIKIFADGVPNRENRESFVPRKFSAWGILSQHCCSVQFNCLYSYVRAGWVRCLDRGIGSDASAAV